MTYFEWLPMSAVHYDSYAEARSHLTDLLDAAEKGRVATVRRDSAISAVVDVKRLRDLLASIVPSRAQVVPEAGGWSVFIPGLPVAADGASFAEAVDEMVDALRAYVQEWQERLLDAPNYRDNWGLVHLISSVMTGNCVTGLSVPRGDFLAATNPQGSRDVRPDRRLISCAGVDEGEVAALSKDEALAKLQRSGWVSVVAGPARRRRVEFRGSMS
ncbi:type II toxin-antitoxin system HicB family antitoxin [Actinophytocola sediminis]